jgi:hypothetical protein
MAPRVTPVTERFVTYEYVEFWPELTVAVNELEARLRLDGLNIAADTLLIAYDTMRRQLLDMSRSMAVFATKELVNQERQTRVRPDTQGGGGPRLEDHLVAESIEPDLMPGAVGVADKDVLENGVPWWITNELGSSARVGGSIFGVFHGSGGYTAPDTNMFREHPLFTATDGSDPDAGPGTIQNPIPARHFIARAAPIISAEWERRFRAIHDQFMHELNRIAVMNR